MSAVGDALKHCVADELINRDDWRERCKTILKKRRDLDLVRLLMAIGRMLFLGL